MPARETQSTDRWTPDPFAFHTCFCEARRRIARPICGDPTWVEGLVKSRAAC
jgi:hypothetical protein